MKELAMSSNRLTDNAHFAPQDGPTRPQQLNRQSSDPLLSGWSGATGATSQPLMPSLLAHQMKRNLWLALWLAVIAGVALSVPIFIASQVTVRR